MEEEEFQEEPWGKILKELVVYIVKWTLKIIVALFIILFLLDWFIGSYLVPDYQGQALKRMMESLINMPYEKQRAEYQNNNNDLANITDEDWRELKCTNPIINYVVNPGETVVYQGKNVSEEQEKKYKNCVGIGAYTRYKEDKLYLLGKGSDEITEKFCTHPMTCNLITIGVNDYVLQNPKILKNLVKIAERPCDYIKKPEEITEEEISEWEGRYGHKGEGRSDIEYEIRDNNRILCRKSSFLTKSSKQFVEIYIRSSDVKRSDIRIFVRRKDI